uniref:Uncharacterized protein n=1 Tax=Glossina austeni TaxID=7395 RepID=A0A1A9VFC2_GLOAU
MSYKNLKYVSLRVITTLALNLAFVTLNRGRGVKAQKNSTTALLDLTPITDLLPLDIIKPVRDLMKTLPALHQLLVLLVELLEKIVPLLKDVIRSTAGLLQIIGSVLDL